MKTILLSLSGVLFLGCSSKNLDLSWQKTKDASYKAISDPVTWVPAVGATALYATYDDDITQYYMDHNIINNNIDEPLRHLNGTLLYASAIFAQNETKEQTTKRLAVDIISSNSAKIITGEIGYIVTKKTPNGEHNDAIGSHHATDTFANSALTRKNVKNMSIPNWGKYTINTISYISATGSAFVRVQGGGHSFGDQMMNASIGNFVGVFFYELFFDKNENSLQSINAITRKDKVYITTNWSF